MKSMQSLPEPSPAAKEYSQRLLALIKQRILNAGSISFAEFMEMALYAPGLGYYSAGSHKLGASGDFVTAPEISDHFSYCIARQIQEILATLQQPTILEIGAGSGIMAANSLQYLADQNALPDRYLILEVSADLRARQETLIREHCPKLIDRVHWLDRLPETPIAGVIVANEVLDAFPATLFTIRDNNIFEIGVTLQDDQLCFTDLKASSELIVEVKRLQTEYDLPTDDYQSEICLRLPSWLKSISECLSRGLILMIDYGFPEHEYYIPSRNLGTLMCHYQQRAHGDPFFAPGLQDITAHVNFTQIARSADASGLHVAGYTHQAAFLLNCGITEMLAVEDEILRFKQTQALKILTLPHEMGELFKVMALTKEISQEVLVGFSQMDQRYRLD